MMKALMKEKQQEQPFQLASLRRRLALRRFRLMARRLHTFCWVRFSWDALPHTLTLAGIVRRWQPSLDSLQRVRRWRPSMDRLVPS